MNYFSQAISSLKLICRRDPFRLSACIGCPVGADLYRL